MRPTTPKAWLNTTPRRLVVTFLGLIMVGTIAQSTVTTASGNLSATATNTNNTYAADTCFPSIPVAVSATIGAAFTPANVTIKAGCSIKWTRTGGNHTTTNTTPSSGSLWNAPLNSSNLTFQRTFSTTGSFPYKCTIHGVSMSGTITVN